MDFGHALAQLKAGNRVTRAQWNGKGQYLELQKPDEHSKMRKPYIYIKPVDDEFVPWASFADRPSGPRLGYLQRVVAEKQLWALSRR